MSARPAHPSTPALRAWPCRQLVAPPLTWTPYPPSPVMLADLDLRERLSGEALDPMPMTSDQFGQSIRDIARWSRVAKQRNIPITD